MVNGAAAPSVQNGTGEGQESFKLKFCTVCASNQNRYAPTQHSMRLAASTDGELGRWRHISGCRRPTFPSSPLVLVPWSVYQAPPSPSPMSTNSTRLRMIACTRSSRPRIHGFTRTTAFSICSTGTERSSGVPSDGRTGPLACRACSTRKIAATSALREALWT